LDSHRSFPHLGPSTPPAQGSELRDAILVANSPTRPSPPRASSLIESLLLFPFFISLSSPLHAAKQTSQEMLIHDNALVPHQPIADNPFAFCPSHQMCAASFFVAIFRLGTDIPQPNPTTPSASTRRGGVRSHESCLTFPPRRSPPTDKSNALSVHHLACAVGCTRLGNL
jgi:hypothetical protein